jgi:hypothetical protein
MAKGADGRLNKKLLKIKARLVDKDEFGRIQVELTNDYGDHDIETMVMHVAKLCQNDPGPNHWEKIEKYMTGEHLKNVRTNTSI